MCHPELDSGSKKVVKVIKLRNKKGTSCEVPKQLTEIEKTKKFQQSLQKAGEKI